MSDPNADRVNTPKIEAQLETLRRLRAAGELRVGWGVDECPPTHATAFVKTGLAIMQINETGRIVRPV